MGGSHQPYMYDPDSRDPWSAKSDFDPKAVTRASWEARPVTRRRQDGPLVSFNRHPDMMEIPSNRTSTYIPMSDSMKTWIVRVRWVQLAHRVVELVAAMGLVALMILISDVDPLTLWVMRIAPGVVAVSCVYAILHLKKHAGSRTPASSAAYQFFAAFTDAATLVFYVFGLLAVKTRSDGWTTLLSNQAITHTLIMADFYTLLFGISNHLGSLAMSLWLGWMFRRITKMPPDMNPLERHLTTRHHKRNKSSIATSYSGMSEHIRRLDTALEEHRRSGAPYEDTARPPSIPFMHTRTKSHESAVSCKNELPSFQQYQPPPASSARNSVSEMRHSFQAPPTRGSYTEVPLHETNAQQSSSFPDQPENSSPTRVTKFTEAWYASESLINRTQQRQRAMNAAATSAAASKSRAYEALDQRYNDERYNDDGVSDNEDPFDSDRENDAGHYMRPDPTDVSDLDDSMISMNGGGLGLNGRSIIHPNPLRLNPTPSTTSLPSSPPSAPPAVPPHGSGTTSSSGGGGGGGGSNKSESSLAKKLARVKTPYHYADGRRRSLVRITGNAVARAVSGGSSASGGQQQQQRRASGTSCNDIDITDLAAVASHHKSAPAGSLAPAPVGAPVAARDRLSSIQPESAFCYTKPYGELRAATPPVMVGSERQVSSGNDYDIAAATDPADSFGVQGSKYRRNVSGKMAEEGLAGRRYSRYSRLNH